MQLSPEDLEVLARHRPRLAHRWNEPRGSVGVYSVIDHGVAPAFGEVCMASSADPAEALEQACRLARSASIRAGLLGVARAGAAVVVVPDPALERETCLQLLHDRLAASPLRVLAGAGLHDVSDRLGPAVHHDPEGLARLRARVLEACLAPVLPRLAGATALVLGAGPRGRDLAAALQQRGAAVSLWDTDPAAARAVAEPLGLPVHEGGWVEAEVDVLLPCTPEPMIDRAEAEAVAARVICGGAPRVLASAEARGVLEAREHWCVTELLAASAELVALVVAEGLLDEPTLLERVEETARELLTTPRDAHERAVTLAVARSKDPSAVA